MFSTHISIFRPIFGLIFRLKFQSKKIFRLNFGFLVLIFSTKIRVEFSIFPTKISRYQISGYQISGYQIWVQFSIFDQIFDVLQKIVFNQQFYVGRKLRFSTKLQNFNLRPNFLEILNFVRNSH